MTKKKQKKSTKQRPLTDKQKVFIECYLQCWNASEAARLAGYSVSSARVAGHRLITNDNVLSAINARISELKMGADETLVRLASHARSSMETFVNVREDGAAELDLTKAEEAKALHLIKKLKTTRRTIKNGESEVTTEIELHDSQAALVVLGKHHKLFTEKVLHGNDPDNPLHDSDEDIRKAVQSEMSEWRKSIAKELSGIDVLATQNISSNTTA